MKFSRTSRFVAAIIAVFSLLFTQLAVASYVCPGMSMPERATMTADAGMPPMANCTGMDKAQPSLCHAYGHTGHQSLDKPDLPQIPPFHPITLVQTVILLDVSMPTDIAALTDTSLAHAIAPPVSIRHCCFRI
ncbi:hypothetical protein ACFFKC_22045 [Pseudoduganella danionis]|uniref:Copper resistance protein n=4 Tax=Telluria group TaxID=2895353 RepID=A0A845I6G4_9BURK|nr:MULTISPECIES: hypothetical protein [Telluria group]MRW91835.1 hypothetical protein [Duganella guangzhouensis]MTW35427.1 hypothetical protein [Pseudoduganella danionis]MYN47626.1 hypothetical protein [Duganella fentianensis]